MTTRYRIRRIRTTNRWPRAPGNRDLGAIGGDFVGLIGEDEALHIINRVPISVSEESVHISEACGRALAESIIAPDDSPPFDRATMDGFAVAGSADRFRIVGEIAAGSRERVQLSPGECARIMRRGRRSSSRDVSALRISA